MDDLLKHGLMGIVGEEAFKLASEVVQELEDEGMIAEQNVDDDSDDSDDDGDVQEAQRERPPSPIQVGGCQFVRTGFTHGVVANVHIGQASASSSSSEAPPLGPVIGVLERVNSQGIKATCRRHRRCVCWLNFRHSSRTLDDAESDLAAWLLSGTKDGATIARGHQVEAAKLKREWGMRVS